jgi:uncharacterized membrane protein YvbJ
MPDTEGTKKCPYCSEEILATAKKCKHCGEWLEESKERKGTDWLEKGSVDARAVAKGIKEKEQAEFSSGCLGFIVLIIAIVLGVGASSLFNSSGAGWVVGIIVFIIGMVFVSQSYFKE